MKVSEMMKYPKLKELLRVNWSNGSGSGEFDTPTMTRSLSLGFVWKDSEVPFLKTKKEAFAFWNTLRFCTEDECKKLYPDLFTPLGSGKYHAQRNVTSLSDDFNRNTGVKNLNTTNPHQLIARLLLSTTHEHNGHKQVIFNTYITHEELLGIAECINKIIEDEEQDGFVTVRWSGSQCVDLYIDAAWSSEENNGRRDQLIASWEW